MKQFSKIFAILFALALLIANIGGIPAIAGNVEEVDLTDLAGNIFSASSEFIEGDGSVVGAANLAFDNDTESRWNAAADTDEWWLAIEFYKDVTFTAFHVNECTSWNHITSYEIQAYVNGAWVAVYEGDETVNEKVTLSAPVTTNQVRLYAKTYSTDQYGPTVYEFDVFGTYSGVWAGQLLTEEYEFAVTASSDDGNIAASAFDGNIGTRWSAAVGEGSTGWIEVEFKEPVTFAKFSINECKKWGNVTSYNIQCDIDGSYVTVYTGTTIIDGKIIALPSAYTTTKIRINSTSVAADRYDSVTFWEISYYGDADSTSTDDGNDNSTPTEGNTGNNDNQPNTPTGDVMPVILIAVIAFAYTAVVIFKKEVNG